MEYTGYCTYYDLPGRMTASGEMFNPNSMTCAMTKEKAALGTRVRVKSEMSGREINVKVNDRGPFERSRDGKAIRPLRPDKNIVIDLTPAAFREMVGNLGPGKVRVTVNRQLAAFLFYSLDESVAVLFF